MKEPMMADSHEITVRNYKQPMRNRLIMMLICIGIALTSFFVVSKWATSVESYHWVIKTLNGLQKKALGLSGTATALATGAAAIPGEAATPIANKLADVAGYMVIVYAVIIVEKYLLTITGYIAFKILFPIGCVLLATGNFLKNGWKEFIYRIGIKSIILGVLLWGLVPTSAWVTNMVNETYAKSYEADFTLEDTEELLDEEVIGHGVIYLHLIAVMYILPAVTNAIQGFFRGIGDLKVTLMSSFTNMAVRVIAAAPMILLWNFGIEALPYSYLAGWVAMLLVETPLMIRIYRKK